MKRPARWLICLLCLSGAVLAEPGKDDLRRLEGSIDKVSQELKGFRQQRGEAEQALRSAEQRIGQLAAEMSRVRAERDTQRRRLADLQAERAALEQDRHTQQQALAAQLKTGYQLGRQPELKVLLEQQEPARVSRALYYLRKLNEARAGEIDRLKATLQSLQALEPQILAESDRLAASEQTLADQAGQLAQQRAEREAAMKQLDASIQDKDGELKKLKAERQQLEKLLAEIAERARREAERAERERREREARERAAARAPAERPDAGGRSAAEAALDGPGRGTRVASDFDSAASGKAFGSLKGRLPWPVAGRLANHFGDPRAGGALRWQGVTIRASTGTAVRAVHKGRVVFADWFRGSGQLMVVDHGGGFMTLYAHNQSLLKKVGDSVTAGERIATVGSSGGEPDSGLYFEIRFQGSPQNPQQWCRGRG